MILLEKKHAADGLTRLQAVRSQIAEAQKIASGSGSEIDIAEAKIELEVCSGGLAFHRVSLADPSIGFGEPPSPPEIGACVAYYLTSQLYHKSKVGWSLSGCCYLISRP